MRKLLALVSCVFLVLILATPASAQSLKKWSFIVFLNGDNNLDPFGDTNIDQMKAVGSTDDVNIIVLRDRYDQKISSKIYYVTKGDLQVVKDYQKNIDMGDYKNMVELFKFVAEKYPAEHYLFDVWNHGGGWKRRNLPAVRDISIDEHTGHIITTAQLAVAMNEMRTVNHGQPIDVLGMDACLMQMAEVANQVAPSVEAVVTSEQTEPGSGWDYTAPLAFLAKTPDASGLEFGAQIADAYVKANGENTQGSSVSTEKLVIAKDKVAAFADALARFDVLDRAAVQGVMSKTTAFYYSDYKDFINFADRIAEATVDKQLKGIAQEASAAVKGAVFANYTTIENANGLSIWLPDKSTFDSKKAKYATLSWGADTGWTNFLTALYNE
jgi:hypothetical protein